MKADLKHTITRYTFHHHLIVMLFNHTLQVLVLRSHHTVLLWLPGQSLTCSNLATVNLTTSKTSCDKQATLDLQFTTKQIF